MIKVLVYWESGSGAPTKYTLKEFQELFNSSTDWDKCGKINGNRIEFIVE